MGTEEFNRTSSPHHHPDYTALFHSTAPWILSRTMDLCHEQKLKRRCWGSGPADWGDTQRGYTLCAYIEIYAYHVLYLHIFSTLNQIEMFRVKIWKEPGMPYRDTIFSQHIFISSNCSRGCLVGSLWRIQTLIMRLVRTRLRTNQGLIWQALPLSLRKWNLSETTWGMRRIHCFRKGRTWNQFMWWRMTMSMTSWRSCCPAQLKRRGTLPFP